MSKTIINVLGAGRSGTTMLDLMLGNDDRSFSMGEVHAWFRPFRKHHKTIDCNCGDPDCDIWNKVKHYSEAGFFKNIFSELDVDFIIDSSKFLPWIIDQNDKLYQSEIKIVNFIVYKPIINYVYSVWKRGESVDAALNRYKLYYKRFLESGLMAHSIDFQDLVLSTDKVLNTIVGITGQLEVEQRSQFWLKEHHHLYGSGGIRNQVRKGSSLIKEKNDYPEEFMKVMEKINKRVEGDAALSEIVTLLKQINCLHVERTKELTYTKKVIKPKWYYYLKLKNKYRSLFTEQEAPKH